MRPLLILPTYNEIENIDRITAAIFDAVPEGLDILVVDDQSPDGTGKRADELSAADSRLHVHHRASKEGLGPAYVGGFQWALDHSYDAVITFDADFSHPTDQLPLMLQRLQEFDVVVGSRYAAGGKLEGWPLRRYLLSRCANVYAQWVGGMPVLDCTGGFNGLRTSVLQAMGLQSLTSRGYGFMHELKYRASRLGFSFSEFPITFRDRIHGTSKMNGNIIFEAFFKVLALRCQRVRSIPTPEQVGCADVESK